MKFQSEQNNGFPSENGRGAQGESSYFTCGSTLRDACMRTCETDDPSQAIPYAREALRIIEEHGGEAWLVGGWVRDVLLQKPCLDVDIATSLYPQDCASAFKAAGWLTVPTGIKHGTITVHVPHMLSEDDCCVQGIETAQCPTSFEITTYRSDGEYLDARHPSGVCFIGSIEEDLARRDFTCNAMAYHPERGLIDPYGATLDIKKGVLRAVGNPQERFQEDALRILRGLRFSAQFGFSIEEQTAAAMLEQRHLVRTLSAERVSHELTLLLCGDYVLDVLLDYKEIMCEAIPELAPCVGFNQMTKYHCYDVFEHIARTVANTPPTPLDRWVALLHDIAKPQTFFIGEDGAGHFYGHGQKSDAAARTILERLKMPGRFIDDACLLVHYHDSAIHLDQKAVKRALRRFGNLMPHLLNIKRADSLAHAPQYRERAEAIPQIQKIIDQIHSANDAYTLKQLAISGNDLLEAGYEPGPVIGMLLNACLDGVIGEKVPNEKNALLTFAKDAFPTISAESSKHCAKNHDEPVSSHGVPLL